jgi:hypothetical protein
MISFGQHGVVNVNTGCQRAPKWRSVEPSWRHRRLVRALQLSGSASATMMPSGPRTSGRTPHSQRCRAVPRSVARSTRRGPFHHPTQGRSEGPAGIPEHESAVADVLHAHQYQCARCPQFAAGEGVNPGRGRGDPSGQPEEAVQEFVRCRRLTKRSRIKVSAMDDTCRASRHCVATAHALLHHEDVMRRLPTSGAWRAIRARRPLAVCRLDHLLATANMLSGWFVPMLTNGAQ